MISDEIIGAMIFFTINVIYYNYCDIELEHYLEILVNKLEKQIQKIQYYPIVACFTLSCSGQRFFL